MNQFDPTVFDLYNVQPASQPSGTQAGVPFVGTNSNNPGIGVGIALTSFISFPIVSNPLYSANVAANSASYIPLSDFSLPEGVIIETGETNSDTCINFGFGAMLTFETSAEDITVFSSWKDIYGQEMTYQVNVANGNPATYAPRCGQKLYSIYATNITGNLTSLTINLSNQIELPYYDFGQAAFLLNIVFNTPESFSTNTNIVLESTSDTYFQQETIYQLASSNPFDDASQTLTSGTVRTIYTIDLDLAKQTNIFIRQAVFGCGNPLPPKLGIQVDGYDLNETLVNNPISVIGGKQYSTGWKGWQG